MEVVKKMAVKEEKKEKEEKIEKKEKTEKEEKKENETKESVKEIYEGKDNKKEEFFEEEKRSVVGRIINIFVWIILLAWVGICLFDFYNTTSPIGISFLQKWLSQIASHS